MLGRWIGTLPSGRFTHALMSATAPVPGERLLGWFAHYAIGVAFAVLLLVVWGLDWAMSPSPGPALIVGLRTIVAPGS